MMSHETSCQEPSFILNPSGLDLCIMEGSRAMLEAEGLIPEGTNWPDGRGDVFWHAGPFRFWLRRRRPVGVKGPIKNVDWWRLRWMLADEADSSALIIRRKAKELADTARSLSAVGQAERLLRANRIVAAKRDASFQQFKVALGIPSSQRRRKAMH